MKEHLVDLEGHIFDEGYHGAVRFYKCDCGLIIGADYLDKTIKENTIMQFDRQADGSLKMKHL